MNQNELSFEQMNELFSMLSKSFWQYLLESFTAGSKNPKKDEATNMAMLLLVAILAYAGVEAVKLLFRSNFGKGGVSTTRMVLSIIVFLLLAGFSFQFYYVYDADPTDWASKSSLLATAIFYFFCVVYMIYNGGIKSRNNNVHPNYRGDSALLGFLVVNWKQSMVQNLAEPMLCLALGVYFLPFSYLWGIPLIFCAISAWLHLAVENVMKLGWIRDGLSDVMSPRNRQKQFSRVTN